LSSRPLRSTKRAPHAVPQQSRDETKGCGSSHKREKGSRSTRRGLEDAKVQLETRESRAERDPMISGNSQTGDLTVAGRRRMRLALVLVGVLAAIEAMGGFYAASLAVVADAVALLACGAVLAFARAARLQSESALLVATSTRRLVLTALSACCALVLAAAFLLYEAYLRALNPPVIHAGLMLSVAVTSLIARLVTMRLLDSTSAHPVRRTWVALLDATINPFQMAIAAFVIITTGWRPVDAIVGTAIALYLLPQAWVLANQALCHRTRTALGQRERLACRISRER
jgi:Co/Zn/Cd efflux system component